MASTYKGFANNDVTTTKTLLHEAIPLTGTIVSGTYYVNPDTQTNIKRYAHGMWESVYDYPYLSSSANHIFDLTVGYAAQSHLSGAASMQNAKKINIYNQMAQVLVGFDATGSIRRFDRDGDLVAGGDKMDEVFFVNYARLLTKDEIKKGSYTIKLYPSGTNKAPGAGAAHTYGDYGAGTSYKTNSPAGDYGLIKNGSSTGEIFGHIYYQAGVAVLTASIFNGATNFGPNSGNALAFMGVGSATPVDACLTGSLITSSCEALRNRWSDNDFNNTTELNSTVYFCRINNNEFNYSSNPTYVSGSKIRVKNQAIDEPVSYFTTVGLYSPDNALMAVAKISEPLKKTPSTELNLRVRLDY
tara:strand:- start:1213 stop:2283 length:1071 start_codon:yes stop_codon:yes gene_type:complete